LANVRGTLVDDLGALPEVRIHSDDILTRWLKLEPGTQRPEHWKNVKRIMLAQGWEGPDNLRINGRVAKGYWRPWNGPLPASEPQTEIDLGTAIAE
jgi:hypothetical protein